MLLISSFNPTASPSHAEDGKGDEDSSSFDDDINNHGNHMILNDQWHYS